MSKLLQEKITKIREFNDNSVQKALNDARADVIKEINELFYISTEDWDVELIEKRLTRLERAVENFKLSDTKSSLTNNILGFLEE